MLKSVSPQVDFPALENELLKKWQDKGILEKYLHKNNNSKKIFSFLDGPITANNPMGVHHAWGRTYKDLWQRFYNMRGFKQRFQNGFDCQGLWVEVEVEKELNVRTKKDIENIVPGDKKKSIAKFVELCKERVRKFSSIQTEQSKRLGYFMDWDNSYFTMSDENNYMIWYFLKKCFEKGWIYKGKDSVPWCPRCQTAISQHEILTENYNQIVHETVFFKLPIIDNSSFAKTSLLVWTTTPWTIPANVAVGVNRKYTYGLWKNKKTGEQVIFLQKDENGNSPKRILKNKELAIADFLFDSVLPQGEYEKIRDIEAEKLIGLYYKGPFDDLSVAVEAKKENPKTFHSVIDASRVVVATEGTGLLHVAPGAGEEDFDLGKDNNLPLIMVIKDDASYLDNMDFLSSQNAKKHPEIIIDFLKAKDNGGFMFKTLNFSHRYPVCWRCKTELVWKVAEEWYIAMDVKEKTGNKTLREQMIETAEKITWYPSFGLERELDWLTNMSDWLISKKNRYWGLALPIYECQDCGKFEVIGSKEELQKKAVSGLSEFENHSPHKPFIDEVKIACLSCGKSVSRIDDVGNVWLDAGIVPFSTYIDPKSQKLSYVYDKEYWSKWFPVDFITESFPGQFKNWFYSMIAMSTVLEKTNPFKQILGYGSMLDENGKAMHKSAGNFIEFNQGADKMGVDVMRWMFISHNPELNLLFGYRKADDTRRNFHLMLWNIYNFFITYALLDKWEPEENSKSSSNILDRWILIRLSETISQVTLFLEKYQPQEAALLIQAFVGDLSLWHVRRSRDRVGLSAMDQTDKKNCYQTLSEVLVELSKVMAPFTPFLAEEIFTNLTGLESVHLANWPSFKSVQSQEDKDILEYMSLVRRICELGHAQRKTLEIKVRQPLASLKVAGLKVLLTQDLMSLIKDELNVKDISLDDKKGELRVIFDSVITVQLEQEGEAREIIRTLQQERKRLGVKLDQKINVVLSSWPKQFEDYIKTKALVGALIKGDKLSVEVK